MITRLVLFVFLAIAVAPSQISAQTLTTLYSFGDVSKQVGVHPAAPLLYAPDGLLYGSTTEGIGAGILHGAIFKIAKDGSDLGTVKQFTNVLEGSNPQGRLVLGGDTLYGLTTSGGAYGGGTVFRVKTNATDFAVLLSLPQNAFSNQLQIAAIGGLTLGGSTLYGVTPRAGNSNAGTVFRVNTDGSDYALIKDFSGDDGALPCGDLLLSGSTLYGATGAGGTNSLGTVFRVETDGTGFTTLKTFESRFFPQEGGAPGGGLVLADGVLYGSTLVGNSNPVQDPPPMEPRDDYIGTVFSLRTDGSEFQTLTTIGPSTNRSESFGKIPVGTLALDGDTLYGVTSQFAGLAPGPSIFRVKTNGTGLAAAGRTMAGYVRAGITLADGSVFGAAYNTDYLFPAVSQDAQGHLFGGSGVIYTFTGYAGEGGLNSVVRFGDYFYGTTALGGSASAGTIFRVKTNGTDFSVLFSFPGGTNGFKPGSRLAIAGTNIFGVTAGSEYQSYTYQTILYRIGLDGRGYQVLHRFPGGSYFPSAGERPPFLPGPVVFNGRLYCSAGVAAGIVRMNLDGSDYRVLYPTPAGELTVTSDAIYAIAGYTRLAQIIRINETGEVMLLQDIKDAYAAPPGRFVLVGDTLFGLVTTSDANALPMRVFKIRTDGSNFALLDSLTEQLPGDPTRSSLATDGKFLYGVTQPPPPPLLPTANGGSIFRVSTNGTDATVLYEFPLDRGNVRPDGELIIENNTIVGSTYSGGDAGQGTIFRLDLTPKLNVALTESGVTLSWPAYPTRYKLETTTNLSQPNWTTLDVPDSATNTILTGKSQTAFFRLQGP
jgi:uncharacterized repeat protein (TIGR03803 family)